MQETVLKTTISEHEAKAFLQDVRSSHMLFAPSPAIQIGTQMGARILFSSQYGLTEIARN